MTLQQINCGLILIMICAVVVAESEMRDAKHDLIKAKQEAIEELRNHMPEHTHVYHDGSARWE